MKKFKELFNEGTSGHSLISGDAVTFLEIRYTENMLQVNFAQKQLVEFIRKLKGGSKKKVFLQILE